MKTFIFATALLLCLYASSAAGLSSMVTVSLKNEVAFHKNEFAGDYQISKTVNGKPSWKSGGNAIWYNPHGYWLIGYWNKLGEDDGELVSPDQYEGIIDIPHVWKYYDNTDNIWITTSDSNDVIISSSEAGGEAPVNANFGGYGGKRSADAQRRCYTEYNQECSNVRREVCYNNGSCEYHDVQECKNIPREVCN